MVCYMFICLQNCLNVSDVKFMPASEKILSPNSIKIILAAFTRSSAARLSVLFKIGNFL